MVARTNQSHSAALCWHRLIPVPTPESDDSDTIWIRGLREEADIDTQLQVRVFKVMAALQSMGYEALNCDYVTNLCSHVHTFTLRFECFRVPCRRWKEEKVPFDSYMACD
jgi:hypothetical protein